MISGGQVGGIPNDHKNRGPMCSRCYYIPYRDEWSLPFNHLFSSIFRTTYDNQGTWDPSSCDWYGGVSLLQPPATKHVPHIIYLHLQAMTYNVVLFSAYYFQAKILQWVLSTFWKWLVKCRPKDTITAYIYIMIFYEIMWQLFLAFYKNKNNNLCIFYSARGNVSGDSLLYV